MRKPFKDLGKKQKRRGLAARLEHRRIGSDKRRK